VAKEVVEFPITGKIIEVHVKTGARVKEGDVLCTLESMKMENPIVAPVDGTVTEINLKAGVVVEAGDQVAVIEY
jgi:biotin carboxyl carrier protein